MSSTRPDNIWPDWQASWSYRYTTALTKRQWAWEFLRRNSEFWRELSAARRGAEISFSKGGLRIVRSTTDLSLWGVLFRGFRER